MLSATIRAGRSGTRRKREINTMDKKQLQEEILRLKKEKDICEFINKHIIESFFI